MHFYVLYVNGNYLVHFCVFYTFLQYIFVYFLYLLLIHNSVLYNHQRKTKNIHPGR
nr:MAG TPA: hypothetical protein [Caudoviricetes sp.]